MERTQVNPWEWNEKYGYTQAWRIDAPQTIVYLAGQVPVAPDGTILGDADFETQARQVFRNLETVLAAAGATFENVVKVTVFLTDMSHLRDYVAVKSEFVTGRQPASTALEVKSLAFPGMMIEVEAVAVL